MIPTNLYASLSVYVPRDGSPAQRDILPGSGIVGSATSEGQIVVDYEGNKFESEQFARYGARVGHAAGRHITQYPTVARRVLSPEDLIEVGTWDGEEGRIMPTEQGATALASWLGLSVDDPAFATELLSNEGHYEHQRTVQAAAASEHPAHREWARAERLRLDSARAKTNAGIAAQRARSTGRRP